MDTFQHGWDLAKATGQDTDLDPELAAGLLANVGISQIQSLPAVPWHGRKRPLLGVNSWRPTTRTPKKSCQPPRRVDLGGRTV